MFILVIICYLLLDHISSIHTALYFTCDAALNSITQQVFDTKQQLQTARKKCDTSERLIVTDFTK